MTSRFYGFGQSFVMVHRTQVVLVDRGADSAAQIRTCFLVGPKMYPAVNACVGDIVGDLLKGGVLQNDGGHGRIGQRDRVSGFAVQAPQHLGRSVASTAVV